MALAPWFASERYGNAPFRNCRGSSGFAATMIATDNEAALTGKGRPRGKAGRTGVLRKGWRAFATQTPADSNGWPDQGDVVLMHQAMFPGLPLPTRHDSGSGDDVWSAIGRNAVSLAIYTGAVGAGDAIRKYVGPVSHQGVAWKRMTVSGKRRVKWIDPMHPASDRYTGHWVSWDSLRKCARAVPLRLGAPAGGRYIYELFPAGQWTQAKLETERKRTVIRTLRKDLQSVIERRDKLREKADGLAEDLASAALEIGSLRQQLEDCERGCDDQVIAGLLDQFHDLEMELRP